MKLICVLTILSSIVLAGVFPANSCATELNVEGVVTLTPSCAPWDGEAYLLKFDLPADLDFPKAHFQGSIWGKGIEHLKSARAFSIDGPEGSHESTGDAYVSWENKRGVFVKAKFSPMFEPGKLVEPIGFGQWMIEIPMPSPSTKKYIYTINPVIPQIQARCG